MCTLTWAYSPENNGYHIHFNRDESRQRAQGIPPRIQRQNGVEFIAPIDPQASGTWILSNQYGLSACLLNSYIDITPVDSQRSRGLLVRDLSCARNVADARQRLETAHMRQYQPFDIYLFDPGQVQELRWDGTRLRASDNPPPCKSSSGFDADNVIAGRLQQFQRTAPETASLREFHRSHHPEKSAYSVCMHREDARTQSYTEIRVDRQFTSMSYIDGPPCEGVPAADLSLRLSAATAG